MLKWNDILAVARNGGHSTRPQIEPPDPLIVQVAEVQRTVGSDRQTVRVVDLPIRIAWHSRADERRNRGLRGKDGRRDQDSQYLQRFTPLHSEAFPCLPLRVAPSRE